MHNYVSPWDCNIVWHDSFWQAKYCVVFPAQLMQRCPLRSLLDHLHLDISKTVHRSRSQECQHDVRAKARCGWPGAEILVKALPGKVTERKGSIFYTVQLPGGRGCGGHPHRRKKIKQQEITWTYTYSTLKTRMCMGSVNPNSPRHLRS